MQVRHAEDDMRFEDRRDAGRQLAAALARLGETEPLVLALPRGGVPVAFEVARALEAPLDLLMVRKIGAPGQEELGLGAVVDGAVPQVVLNEEVLAEVRPPPGYIEQQTARELAEIRRRRDVYLRGRPALPVRGRTIILVDDGIATGGTVRAALQALRRAEAGRIVLAVPVAAQEALDRLAQEADAVVCLAAPADFRAVGFAYRRFDQTSDAEVIRLLDASAAAGRTHPGPRT